MTEKLKTNASFSKEHKGPHVIKEEDIKKIYNFMIDIIGQVEITVKRRDKIEIKVNSLEELFDLENYKDSKIISLELVATGENWRQRASYKIRVERYLLWAEDIDYNLSLPLDKLLITKEKIEQITYSMRPWYGFISKINLRYVLLILPLLLFFFLSFLYGMDMLHANQEALLTYKEQLAKEKQENKIGAMIPVVIILWILSAEFLEYLNCIAFKKSYILIGYEKKVFERHQWLRTTLLVAFIVAPLIAYSKTIIGWLMLHFTTPSIPPKP